MGDDSQGTDEVFKFLGRDQTIWGVIVDYIYVFSHGSAIEISLA